MVRIPTKSTTRETWICEPTKALIVITWSGEVLFSEVVKCRLEKSFPATISLDNKLRTNFRSGDSALFTFYAQYISLPSLAHRIDAQQRKPKNKIVSIVAQQTKKNHKNPSPANLSLQPSPLSSTTPAPHPDDHWPVRPWGKWPLRCWLRSRPLCRWPGGLGQWSAGRSCMPRAVASVRRSLCSWLDGPGMG